MKFVVDDKIPYIAGVLETFADVSYIPGAKISREHLIDADGLIIRTRTKCNEELLEGTAVRFIATATIGFDHIDVDYCSKTGIQWTNAPGCNSESVNQYLASVLTHWSAENKTSLRDKTIGIIGVGNVGSKVARTAEILGMNVLLNDPPRARKEGQKEFVEIDEILEKAEIISLHVPLNPDGIDKTYHLADENFMNKWGKPGLLINTCRGEVMDTHSVLETLDENPVFNCIIDCWENEPDINLKLLKRAFIGTPHIAGYSRDGKANGTSQCIQAISRFFNLNLHNWYPEKIEAPNFPRIILDGSEQNQDEILHSAIQSSYAIFHDDMELRESPTEFEKLRGEYPVRREFNAFTLSCRNIDKITIKDLQEIGFKIDK